MLGAGDFSQLPSPDPATRGGFIGSPGSYRLNIPSPSNQHAVVIGSLCPVANAAATYTITASFAVDLIPTTTTLGPSIYFAAPDDSMAGATQDIANSYLVKLRASGIVQMWEINGSTTATSLGTVTATAFQNLTTTSSLSGTITALPVSALTVALKVGHQFMLPNGQVVTVAGAAIVGATSVTVTSIALSSTIASGATLIPYVTAVINVTPTTVTASRGDESGVGTVSSANAAHRGGYFAAAGVTTPGNVSLHKVVVS
jgi:hypothetical protein